MAAGTEPGISYDKVSTDGSGISKQSRKNLKKMLKLAKHDGHVDVWVSFDIYFTPIPGQRDAAYHQQFGEDMTLATSSTLSALVISGEATILSAPNAVASAPGKLVRVSGKGLESLAENPLVNFIVLMQ